MRRRSPTPRRQKRLNRNARATQRRSQSAVGAFRRSLDLVPGFERTLELSDRGSGRGGGRQRTVAPTIPSQKSKPTRKTGKALVFWAQSCNQPADAALETAQRSSEPVLNAAFETSSLAGVECTLRYCQLSCRRGCMGPRLPRHCGIGGRTKGFWIFSPKKLPRTRTQARLADCSVCGNLTAAIASCRAS